MHVYRKSTQFHVRTGEKKNIKTERTLRSGSISIFKSGRLVIPHGEDNMPAVKIENFYFLQRLEKNTGVQDTGRGAKTRKHGQQRGEHHPPFSSRRTSPPRGASCTLLVSGGKGVHPPSAVTVPISSSHDPEKKEKGRNLSTNIFAAKSSRTLTRSGQTPRQHRKRTEERMSNQT